MNLNDWKKYIVVAKINIKEVNTASEEYPNTHVEDEISLIWRIFPWVRQMKKL